MKALPIILITSLIMGGEIAAIYLLRHGHAVKNERSNTLALSEDMKAEISPNGLIYFSANNTKVFVGHLSLSSNVSLKQDKVFVMKAKIKLNPVNSTVTIKFLNKLPANMNKLTALRTHLATLSDNYILLVNPIAKEVGFDAIKIEGDSFKIVESELKYLTVSARYLPLKQPTEAYAQAPL